MPRLPVPLVNLALRIAVKPTLAEQTSVDAMRRRLERAAHRLFRVPRGTEVAEETLAARGRKVPALRALPAGADPARLVLFFHGGAYIAGSPRTHLHLAARLAGAAGAAAVVPDYRLAPEHPFPAAPEDALAAYAALLAAGHPAGRIAVAGDSAGGGLAAALLLLAADAGLAPPAALVAFSPWADMTGRADSLRRNARADPMLPAGRLDDVAGMILQGADRADPRASPALGRFVDPPPALVFTSRTEIITDDAEALARALEAAGGGVRLVRERGLPHDWAIFAGWMRAADRTVAEAGAFLAGRLGAAPEPEPAAGG